jgi:hypothetical protein
MEKQQKIQDLKIIVNENETRYVFDEETGKSEKIEVSTVAVKLRYGSEQYGEYVICNKPTLKASDVVDVANEIFVSLLSALDQPQEGDGNGK